MSIKELPRATSRLLSSSQVLTTPASLVKELLDNALDANATSIDIVIAANTLDKIEVRDNGHGITLQDLNVIGKRGYTSKLRNFNEVKTIGGLSLGFRGEALASAVELGDVSITTRVEGEVVATSINLNAHDGISSQTSISHPVGTTVCVTNFFSRLPVRKQTALKDARKTMSRIKEMLQSYALARLNVRLTLKVLKATKSNWSFAPRANEGTREIISHVIGRETAAQCVEMISTLVPPSQVDSGAYGLGDHTLGDSTNHKSLETPPESAFIIQALLPKSDADLTKISGAQYISIDSRPVSSARGSPKKIVSIYKTMISAMSVDDLSEKVKSPFLRLNIVCPMGSYDPNVEPAKDNVLFENENVLLSLVEDWFRSVYGNHILATIETNKTSTNQNKGHDIARSSKPIGTLIINNDSLHPVKLGITISETSDKIDEDVYSVYKSASETSPGCGVTRRTVLSTSPEIRDALPPVDQPRSGFDMSEDHANEVELDEEDQASDCYQTTAEDTRNKHTSNSFNRLNPWVIAKLNTPVVKKIRESNLVEPAGDSTAKWPMLAPSMLPTPRESSIFRLYPAHRNLRSLERRSYGTTAASDNSQSSIEGWLRQSRELFHNPNAFYDNPWRSPESSDRVRAFSETGSDVIDRDMSFDMLRSLPTTQVHSASKILRNGNRPFVSPLIVAHMAVPSATESRVKSLPSHRPQSSAELDIISNEDVQDRVLGDERRSEVHEALDFERRKEAATRKLRKQLLRSQSGAEVPSTPENDMAKSSPHKNQCHATVAALEINQTQSTSGRMKDKMLNETCLPDDPKSYLMGRQKSIAAYSEKPSVGRKLRRTKTMLFPLETISDRTELHGLCQVVSSNIDYVRKALLTLASHDQYATSGNQARGLVMSTADIQAVEMKLKNLVKSWMHVTTSGEVDVVLDLGGLQGRSVMNA
jgi:DNA mismatch repair protein MutL